MGTYVAYVFRGYDPYGCFQKMGGTPKWMVYNGTPIEMDDLGIPLFLETSIY